MKSQQKPFLLLFWLSLEISCFTHISTARFDSDETHFVRQIICPKLFLRQNIQKDEYERLSMNSSLERGVGVHVSNSIFLYSEITLELLQ